MRMPPIHTPDQFNLSQVHQLESTTNSKKVSQAISETESKVARTSNDITARENQNAKIDAKIKSQSISIGEFFQNQRKPFYTGSTSQIFNTLLQ